MSMHTFLPYENESDVLYLGGVTIENRIDRVSMYGSIDITKDIVGLKYALELKRVIDATIKALETDGNLPDKILCVDENVVQNPFK